MDAQTNTHKVTSFRRGWDHFQAECSCGWKSTLSTEPNEIARQVVEHKKGHEK